MTGGEKRVVATLTGVAERGALLEPAAGLADERVDIDDQPRLARTGARRPRAGECVAQHAVELADMAEGECSEQRPER